MKPIPCLFLALSAGLWADEASDRTAIGQVITALNEPPDAPGAKLLSSLFTADADLGDRTRLANLIGRLRTSTNRPWSEVTPPRLTAQPVRFITPDVALVDAAVAQFGSVIGAQRLPVLLVMRRDGVQWKIAAVRNAADPLAFGIVPASQ